MHYTTDLVRKNTYLIYLYTGLSVSFIGVIFRGFTEIEMFVDILFRGFDTCISFLMLFMYFPFVVN